MDEAPFRTLLFVPGNRPERFGKAQGSAADRICLDWEDAVPAGSAKDEARAASFNAFRGMQQSGGYDRIVLRINGVRTAEGQTDLAALGEFGGKLPALMIPKVKDEGDLHMVVKSLGARRARAVHLIALIETVEGLSGVERLARPKIHSSLSGLMIGCVDLAGELGCSGEWESLLYARSRVVHAARLGGLHAIDSPFPNLRDPKGLETEARRARSLGFDAKAAIHPAQIFPLAQAMTPSAIEIARAKIVIDVYRRNGGAPALLDGRLVEKPVYLAALRLAGQSPTGANP